MKKRLLGLVLSTVLLALPGCSSPTGCMQVVDNVYDDSDLVYGDSVASYRRKGFTCKPMTNGRYYTCTRPC